MTKLATTLLLLLSSIPSHSKSWNKLFSESSYFKFADQSPMVIDNKIIYKTKTDDGYGLRSYDLTSNKKSNLIPPDVDYELNDVIQMGDSVYFLIKRFTAQPYFQLWKTNGDLYGTQQVSETEFRTGYFRPSLVVYNDILFARGDNGAILAIKDDEVTTNQLQAYEPYLSRMCVFDLQNYILFDVYNGNKVLHIKNGSVTQISNQFPDGFFIQSATTINNDCYFNYTVYENQQDNKGIMKISQSGEITSFRDSEALNNYHSLFSHNNQAYAFRDNAEERYSTLVRLSNNLIELSQFRMDGQSFGQYLSTKNVLLIQDNVFETSMATQYLLDHQLNLVEKNAVSWTYPLPEKQSLLNSDILLFRNDNSANKFNLKILDEESIDNFESTGFDLISAVSTQLSEKSYFILKNRETGVKSLYSLDDKPNIGQSLSGIWHSANQENQGIMIRPGIRQDGTLYVFVTIYTFKDGKPFWLAGNSDYMPSQSSISVDLYDFKGTNFLELIEVPVRNDFGTITLTPKDCETIEFSLSSNETLLNFEINRIDNTHYDKFCLKALSD